MFNSPFFFLSAGWPHDHHVPRGSRWSVFGLLWTEQKIFGDLQLDSSTHEKIHEQDRSEVNPPALNKACDATGGQF